MKLKILKLFRSVWLGIFCITMIISIVGIFLGADSFWSGWRKLTEVFSPFNLVNWIMVIIFLSPGLLAQKWIDKIETKGKADD
jgi:hypothetical protein